MKEMIEKLTKLIQENPDLPVRMLVDSDEVLPDYRWTEHGIKSVTLSRWYNTGTDEGIYSGINDITEHFMDRCAMDELEATEKAMEESIEVILIKTEAV